MERAERFLVRDGEAKYGDVDDHKDSGAGTYNGVRRRDEAKHLGINQLAAPGDLEHEASLCGAVPKR